MSPVCLRESADGVVLAIKVQPRASRNGIQGLHGNELKISVTAPPVDSAANDAVVHFLADKLNCSRSSIQILRGATSRHKTIHLKGMSLAKVAEKLGFV